ncbi:MAG: DUF547 domain-containing protein [Desulfobacterales bacterium]
MSVSSVLSAFFVSFVIAFRLIVPQLSAATDIVVDNKIYGELLEKYVRNGKVNYAGFKAEEAKLDRYLKILENVNIAKLSRDQQFAFYVNTYNAWTIKLILSGYPGITSIKDLGSLLKSPWKKEIVRIDGKVISLDDVEHNILRPRYQDPRVHFAINCAAKSCPPLQTEPFEGDILDRQLNEATRSFINDPKSYKLEEDKLHVSRIFKWFSEDFKDDILGFFLKYASGDLKKNLEAKADQIQVKYLKYDWSLNGK